MGKTNKTDVNMNKTMVGWGGMKCLLVFLCFMLIDSHSKAIAMGGMVSNKVLCQGSYVVLRNDKSLSEQLTTPNTIYEIPNNFDLNGKTVKIPEGCLLRFSGGIISNGLLEGNNTTIDAGDTQLFDSGLLLTGYWNTNNINVCWFGAKNDIEFNSTDAFRAANKSAWQISNKKKEYEQYGETKTIKITIPNGVYYLIGSNLLGSIREEGKYPGHNTNCLYQIEGNNSIIYWEVNKPNDELFCFDYTVGHQSVRDLKVFVVNNTDKDYAGTVFKIGNTIPRSRVNGRIYDDAGLSHFSDVHITNSRKGKGGIYKVFDVIGSGQCDQALVQRCTFDEFLYCFYSTNPEAVSWNFETCGFYTTADAAKYFYITRLNQYLMVNNSAFSYCDGQTLCEYNCELNDRKKLLGTDRDNIIINNTRFEGYLKNSKDWFIVYKGTAGKLILQNSNFDASSSWNIVHKFLLSDLGSIHIENCAMAKALITIPKYTPRSFGLGNQNDWAVIASNFRCDELALKAYDWDRDKVVDLTDAFLKKGSYYRYADFRDFRGKSANSSKTLSFYITPSLSTLSTIQFEKRSISTTSGEGSLRKNILLPPYCVLRKIEMYDIPQLPSNVDVVRIYAGEKSNGVYRDIPLGLRGSAKAYVDLFEGRIVVFNEDIKKQTIYVSFMDDKGNEVDDGRVQLVLTYTPLVNPTHYSIKGQNAIIEQ